jgi:hypothetical protein
MTATGANVSESRIETEKPVVRKINILIAVLYPLLAVAVFFLTVRNDPFGVFGQNYKTIWLLMIPGILILVTIGLAFTGKAPRHSLRLTLIAWIAIVTYGHYVLIDIAAAGV